MEFRRDNFDEIYNTGQELGNGHFAVVRVCRRISDDASFAGKFIRKRRGLSRKGVTMEEIQTEANILREMRHNNIIRLFDAFERQLDVVLVLELVEGGELFDYVSEQEKLSEEVASQFVRQILEGVGYMHVRHIVHLDLKPENIMIADVRTCRIKIIDFGLARYLKPNEEFRDMVGTAEFVAPEIVNYEAIDFGTDMWAIGVITHILLSGQSPFKGANKLETFQKITIAKVDFDSPPLDEVSDMAKDFISNLLLKLPSERLTAEEALSHIWIAPIEDIQLVRRRNSLITKEQLQCLKNFVTVSFQRSKSMNMLSSSSHDLSNSCDGAEGVVSSSPLQCTVSSMSSPTLTR